MADSNALSHVLGQIEAARVELDDYPPAGFGWYERVVTAANDLVPWLIKEAPVLRVFVEEVLNSPSLVREAWASLKPQINDPEIIAHFDELLNREEILLKFVTGDTVSTVVTGHLLSNHPDKALAGNSKSDYPDIFVKTYDYSKLPIRTRKDKVFGAAIRGKMGKPVRVPDGLEIKTSRDGASIDCHYPHVGLHLMVSFQTNGATVMVDDVLIAFLRNDDYRITKPKTKATTLKASFSRAPFVSLLPTPTN